MESAFKLQIKNLTRSFRNAEIEKIRRTDYLQLAIDTIAFNLVPIFQVDQPEFLSTA